MSEGTSSTGGADTEEGAGGVLVAGPQGGHGHDGLPPLRPQPSHLSPLVLGGGLTSGSHTSQGAQVSLQSGVEEKVS